MVDPFGETNLDPTLQLPYAGPSYFIIYEPTHSITAYTEKRGPRLDDLGFGRPLLPV